MPGKRASLWFYITDSWHEKGMDGIYRNTDLAVDTQEKPVWVLQVINEQIINGEESKFYPS
jgi:hypothetical protein